MTERRLILGTAGHIDHGKTALVKALTGVDTDRLEEEKARGITIDLGFAEFARSDAFRFGVVDVPGHEGFIRNMLAGATGMDVVLLVVAADEGVMPQTREHVDIVRMLGVGEMVVALSKSDLVDPEWLELAREDVRDLLYDTPWRDAAIVPTSAHTGAGLDGLAEALESAAGRSGPRTDEDLARLPVDRVFTVKGTGTVVTGTLWSGRIRDGAAVRLLPDGPEGRVRGLQVHGSDAAEAVSGQRTAVALGGAGLKREDVERGFTLVQSAAWHPTHMLTVHLSVLPDTGWQIVHGQRVRVHLGTAEVMARVALLGDDVLLPSGAGWAQLRLERPVVARGADRFVVRSYSPMTTIGGGTVVEPIPPKRKRISTALEAAWSALVGDDAPARVRAALELRGWAGADEETLLVLTGLSPDAVRTTLEDGGDALRSWAGTWLSGSVAEKGRRTVLARLEAFHGAHPLRPGLPLEQLRQELPHADARVVEGLLAELEADGRIERAGGVARLGGFRADLTPAQRKKRDRILSVYTDAGLAPPSVDDVGIPTSDPEFWPLLKMLEADGEVVSLGDDLYIGAGALADAERQVRETLGGRSDLGPSDFKEVLPVTRKHLIPILGHFDRTGVTDRTPGGRSVTSGGGRSS